MALVLYYSTLLYYLLAACRLKEGSVNKERLSAKKLFPREILLCRVSPWQSSGLVCTAYSDTVTQ